MDSAMTEAQDRARREVRLVRETIEMLTVELADTVEELKAALARQVDVDFPGGVPKDV